MEGEDVSAFAFTHPNKMAGELGHLNIKCYEFWEAFTAQCILRFAPTYEGETSLALMTKVTYKGNIDCYPLEMENHKTHVGMNGVGWRQMVERQIPKEAVQRLSTEEAATDSGWITTLRTVCKREEIFVEQLALQHSGPSVSRNDSGGKRKREEKAVTKPRKQRKQYSAEEKAAYKLKIEAERKGKGPAPAQGKVEHTDWNKAHEGVKDQVVQDRKRAQQCTHCGMNNHKWANCRKTIQVSTISTPPRKQFGQRPWHPTSRQWKTGPITPFRRPQTSAVTRQRSPEGTPRVNQIERPLAGVSSDMELTQVTSGSDGDGIRVVGGCPPSEIEIKNERLQQVDRASPCRQKRTKRSALGKVSSGTQMKEKS